MGSSERPDLVSLDPQRISKLLRWFLGQAAPVGAGREPAEPCPGLAEQQVPSRADFSLDEQRDSSFCCDDGHKSLLAWKQGSGSPLSQPGAQGRCSKRTEELTPLLFFFYHEMCFIPRFPEAAAKRPEQDHGEGRERLQRPHQSWDQSPECRRSGTAAGAGAPSFPRRLRELPGPAQPRRALR